MSTCTCPSGDGSLRWPCPTHPPAVVPLTDEQIDGVINAPKMHPIPKKIWRDFGRAVIAEFCRINGIGDAT